VGEQSVGERQHCAQRCQRYGWQLGRVVPHAAEPAIETIGVTEPCGSYREPPRLDSFIVGMRPGNGDVSRSWPEAFER
jgi:hypothetical protein